MPSINLLLCLKIACQKRINYEISLHKIVDRLGIIREAVKAGIFSEDDSDVCFDMVEARNKTSHTYHELMADDIAHAIPIYRDLMQDMINRMQDAIKNK